MICQWVRIRWSDLSIVSFIKPIQIEVITLKCENAFSFEAATQAILRFVKKSTRRPKIRWTIKRLIESDAIQLQNILYQVLDISSSIEMILHILEFDQLFV